MVPIIIAYKRLIRISVLYLVNSTREVLESTREVLESTLYRTSLSECELGRFYEKFT